jgi:uncharacterized membrane protein YkvA (DUF1232 family)
MLLFRFFLTSRQNAGRALTLLRHPHVPLRLKLLLIAGAVFILSPLNILGDIPLLGILDDVALLSFLVGWFVRSAGPYGDDTSRQTLIVSR